MCEREHVRLMAIPVVLDSSDISHVISHAMHVAPNSCEYVSLV